MSKSFQAKGAKLKGKMREVKREREIERKSVVWKGVARRKKVAA